MGTLFPNTMSHPEGGISLGTVWKSSEGFLGVVRDAEDSFDKVEVIGDAELDGQPAVHYRASRSICAHARRMKAICIPQSSTTCAWKASEKRVSRSR